MNKIFRDNGHELCNVQVNTRLLIYNVGRDRSVGIVTGYWLDRPGMESRLGQDFPHLSRLALRPTQPPVQWVPGPSRGKEWPGRDANPLPHSSAVVKKG